MTGASGVVFVLDSTDIDRLAEVRRELFALLKEPLLDNAPVLILANKQDMSQARNISEISTIIGVSTSGDVEEGGGGGLFDRPIEVIGISCLDGSGISRAIEWLVDQVSNNSRRVIDNK
jgi:signal recognition particle receptor subunit beta